MVSLPLLNADEEACDIGVHVQDDEENPKRNTPVKIIALSHGSVDTTINTDDQGIVLLPMRNWPNSCPGAPCCPAEHNDGYFKAVATGWCEFEVFEYDGTHIHVDIIVEDPCK